MNKNIITRFLFVTSIFSLASCENILPTAHEHTFATEWTHDEINHWRKATCEHDVKKDEATHTFTEWVITTPSTVEQEGKQTRTCSVCGYEQTEEIEKLPHTHEYSDTWSYNETNHWHDATCGHDDKGNLSSHTFYEGICEICGYDDRFIYDSTDSTKLIGLNSKYKNTVTSITIPDNVTSIEAQAFMDCENLESVVIGNNVTEIGVNAFKNCYSLVNVTLPDTLTNLNNGVFYTCNIKSINLPSELTSIGNNCFFGCGNLSSISFGDKLTTIGANAFKNCSQLSEVIIPNNVTSIMMSAFANCEKLTSFRLGTGVKTITSNCFSGCKKLQSFIIPDGVTEIQNGAFKDCEALKTISTPSSVTKAATDIFNGCSDLQTTTYDDIKYIGTASNPYFIAMGLSNSNITSLVLNENTVYIHDNAFKDNKFTSVECSNELLAIGGNSFESCSNLKTIYFGNKLQTISKQAFYKCSSLIEINLPDTITSINSAAFAFCNNVKSLTISKNIVNVSFNAFGCDYLATVKFNGTRQEFKNNTQLIEALMETNAANKTTMMITFSNGATEKFDNFY